MNLDDYIEKLEVENTSLHKANADLMSENERIIAYSKIKGEHITRLNEVLERSVLLNRKALHKDLWFFNSVDPTLTENLSVLHKNQFLKLLEHISDNSKPINSTGGIGDYDVYKNFILKIAKEFWSE